MKIRMIARLARLTILALVVVACSNKVSAQEWTKKMFTEFNHDFQDVRLGDTPVYKFKISNPFNETIRIHSVRSSCGCTIATPTKKILKSQESGEIVCKFNSPAVGTGFKQATVTIRFDYPYVGEAQLIVKGNIVTNISLKPEVVDFGKIQQGEYPVSQVELSSVGNPNLRIHDVKSTFGHIGVSIQEAARSGGQVSYRIFTRLKDTVPLGYTQGELFVEVSEGRNQDGTLRLKKVPIKFNAHVVSPLQLSPDILSLGPLAPGETATKKVFLKSKMPFAIRDVRCESEAFRVKADATTKKVHIVEVTYTGEEKTGRHECELSFYVEYPESANQKGREASSSLKAIVQIAER